MRNALPDSRVALTTSVLAALFLSPATSSAWWAGYSKTAMGAHTIVVGVARSEDPQKFGVMRKTIDVEQWIVPADSDSSALEIEAYSRPQLGKRVMLLLRKPEVASGSLVYPVSYVIDLDDGQEVARWLHSVKEPWIRHVTSATVHEVLDWDSRPFKVPMVDPRLLEMERVLKAAQEKVAAH